VIILATFAAELVPVVYSDYRIKRESGVIPGQSRCCEALYALENTYATGELIENRKL